MSTEYQAGSMRRWSKIILLVLSLVMAAELGVQLVQQIRQALAAKPAAEQQPRR